MNGTIITLMLSSGLFASIVTTLITKWLELKQEKDKHHFGIQKLYFEHKIAAFEKAAIQYTILSNALSTIASVFRKPFDSNNAMNEPLNAGLMNYTQELLKKATDANYELGYCFGLYFDIDYELYINSSPLDEIANKAEIILPLYSEFWQLEQDLASNLVIKNKDDIRKEIGLKQQEIKDAFTEIYEFYNSNKKSFATILIKMRQEMKKYETFK